MPYLGIPATIYKEERAHRKAGYFQEWHADFSEDHD